MKKSFQAAKQIRQENIAVPQPKRVHDSLRAAKQISQANIVLPPKRVQLLVDAFDFSSGLVQFSHNFLAQFSRAQRE